MDKKTDVIFMRVPSEEKQRAKALADQCGLSLTGLWRVLLAETELVPMVTWQPTRQAAQMRLDAGAAQQ